VIWRLPRVGGICIGCDAWFSDKFMPFMNQPPGSLHVAAVQPMDAIHACVVHAVVIEQKSAGVSGFDDVGRTSFRHP
jgi:hypothetical protein